MTKRTIPSDDVYTYYKQALDMLPKTTHITRRSDNTY